METREMGRVIVNARVENFTDAWEVEQGKRKPEEARTVTIEDALVDTGGHVAYAADQVYTTTWIEETTRAPRAH